MDIDSETRPVEDYQMDGDIAGDDDEVMDEDERMDDDMEPEAIRQSDPIQEVELASESTNLTVDPPTLLSQQPPLSPEQYEEGEGEEKDVEPSPGGEDQEPDVEDQEPEEPEEPEDEPEPIDNSATDHHLSPTIPAPEMIASTSRSPRQPHVEYEDEEEYPYPTAASLPPILIHLPDGIRSLFTPHEKIAWLKGKEGDFAEASLADVWTGIRAEMAREGLVKSGELVVTEKQMELKMGEVSLLRGPADPRTTSICKRSPCWNSYSFTTAAASHPLCASTSLSSPVALSNDSMRSNRKSPRRLMKASMARSQSLDRIWRRRSHGWSAPGTTLQSGPSASIDTKRGFLEQVGHAPSHAYHSSRRIRRITCPGHPSQCNMGKRKT